MATDWRLFCFPEGTVRCSAPEAFKLSNENTTVFDSVAQESVNAPGTEVVFYSLNKSRTVVDPLYGEAQQWSWDGPWRLSGKIDFPGQTISVKSEGYKLARTSGGLWLARKDLEDKGAPIPKESDVMGFWHNPYWEQEWITNRASTQPAWFFNVTQVDEDGMLFNGPNFVGFRLTLVRNTEFVPERRLENA